MLLCLFGSLNLDSYSIYIWSAWSMFRTYNYLDFDSVNLSTKIMQHWVTWPPSKFSYFASLQVLVGYEFMSSTSELRAEVCDMRVDNLWNCKPCNLARCAGVCELRVSNKIVTSFNTVVPGYNIRFMTLPCLLSGQETDVSVTFSSSEMLDVSATL